MTGWSGTENSEAENKCGDGQQPVYDGITAFQYSKYEDLVFLSRYSLAGHLEQEERLLVKAPAHIPDRQPPPGSAAGTASLSNLKIRV